MKSLVLSIFLFLGGIVTPAFSQVLTPPSTCTIGETLIDTGAQGQFTCTSTNVWTYLPISTLVYTQINVPNGVAGLDSNGLIPTANLPAGVGGNSFSHISALPSASANNNVTKWVNDGATSTDCFAGNGFFVVACKSNGTNWVYQSVSTAGTPGTNGNTIWNGTTAPTTVAGSQNGDFYLNTATDVLYGPKTSGAWPGVGIALVGASGNTVWNGTTAPTTVAGSQNGDFYINTATGVLYGPKAAGSWPGSGLSLVGAAGSAGAQGIQGIQGVPGINGNTVWNGTVNPSTVAGSKDGDFYINTATNFIFGPRASGAWPSTGVSLIGPAGPSGTGGSLPTIPNGTVMANISGASAVASYINAAQLSTLLGLGTASTSNSAAFDAAGAASTAQAASLQKSSNLSDLANAATARTNLGLGTAATQATSAFDAAGAASAAQAAAIAASDPSGSASTAQAASLQKTNNLSDVSSPSSARTNLGLGTAATQPISAFDAAGAASIAQANAVAAAPGLAPVQSVDTKSGSIVLNQSDAIDTYSVGTGGTTVNVLVATDATANNQVITPSVGSCGMGVALATASSAGTVKVQLHGLAQVKADMAIPVGHLAICSSTTAGYVTDSGQTTSAAIQSNVRVVGTVTTASTGAGTLATVRLHGPGSYGSLPAFVTTVAAITPSTTPTINAANGVLQTITLSANSAPTITGLSAGLLDFTLQICQPSSGGPYTWTWPAAVHGGMPIGTTANACSVQTFDSFNGTTLYAVTPGVINQ